MRNVLKRTDKYFWFATAIIAAGCAVRLFALGSIPCGLNPVSYTHLDVYKRQIQRDNYICRGAYGRENAPYAPLFCPADRGWQA